MLATHKHVNTLRAHVDNIQSMFGQSGKPGTIVLLRDGRVFVLALSLDALIAQLTPKARVGEIA